MESYQTINDLIKKTFHIKNQSVAPFMGHFTTSRLHLAKLFNTLGYRVGAEIGVSKGLHAKQLCKSIEDLKLFLVDPWVGYDTPQITDERANARYKECVERLSPYNVEYVRETSMEAVGSFPDNSLDFIYIDGLHTFDGVMSDLIFWSPKVRSGGIVAGHDYLEFPNGGIIPAVRAYVAGHGIHEWYVTRDKDPSFFWVKK